VTERMPPNVGLILSVVLLGLSVISTAGWANLAKSRKIITEQDNGKTIILKVGERFVLNLRNPASGGYDVVTPVYDAHILKLVSRKDLPPEPTPFPKAGDFGKIVFTGEAAAVGETDLTVQIAREWEKQKPPLDYLQVRIRVIQ
jgi:predicted secreted protein